MVWHVTVLEAVKLHITHMQVLIGEHWPSGHADQWEFLLFFWETTLEERSP